MSRDLSDVARWYERFHGHRGDVVAAVVSPPRELGDLGDLVAVLYRTPAGEVREHPFAPSARPTLARDERGRLHVLGGQFTVTERGITDMSHAMQKYTDPRASLAHSDPRTRYTAAGVPVHGLATPSEGVAVPRHNPVSMVVDGVRAIGQRAGSIAVTVSTAGVTALVSDAIVERTPLSPTWKAAAQVFGTALPGIVAMPHYPDLGTGLVTGGAVAGISRFVRARGWDQIAMRWLQGMMPARAASGVEPGDLPFRVKVEARAA